MVHQECKLLKHTNFRWRFKSDCMSNWRYKDSYRQLSIEAQGKYLKKIIEEQQHTSGMLSESTGLGSQLPVQTTYARTPILKLIHGPQVQHLNFQLFRKSPPKSAPLQESPLDESFCICGIFESVDSLLDCRLSFFESGDDLI